MKKLKIFLASIVVSFMFALTGCDFSISSKEYAVDFIIDNEVSSTAKVEEGSKVSAPENPSKVGYEFLGWYNGETEFDFNSEVKREIDLVAKFEAIQYDLILNLDGGEIEGNFPLSSKYTVEDTVVLPNVTKTGYTFKGWYDEETKYEVISNSTGDKTLIAKFQLVVYDITLDLNGGTIVGDFDIFHDYTIEDTITLPTLTKDGYNFVGWYDGETKYEVISNNTGTKNLLARFELVEYNLEVDLDGGTIEGNFALSSKYTIEDTITLPTPTKTNYSFVGWKESGSPDILARVELDSATGNRNYKAIWRNDNVISLYVDNVLYKSSSVVVGENVLESVDNLDETTIGWFKDEDLHVAVLSTDTVTPGMSLYTKSYSSQNNDIFSFSQGRLTVSYDESWNGVVPRKINNQIITTILNFEQPYEEANIKIFLPSSIVSTSGGVGFANLPNTLVKISGVSLKTQSVSSIEISKDNLTIRGSAFSGMDNLTSVTFESGSQLETIEEHAFVGTSITTITIPSSVKTIGYHSFYGIKTLTSVTFESNSQLETIGNMAFSNTSIETITIPSSVKMIDVSALSGTLTLASVTFESGSQLETIGSGAFLGAKISEITIPSSVKTIGNGAFRHLSTLTKVEFENNSQLETIEEDAFKETSITTITIPSSIKTIGNNAIETSVILIIDSQDIYDCITQGFLNNDRIDVLKSLTGANSYLEDNYDKTESGDYYVYTKKQQG